MNTQEVVEFWLTGAEDDLKSANKLHQGEQYHHALFFGQLYLEKIAKAYLVTVSAKHPLPIHDITQLLKRADLPLTGDQSKELDEISSFSMEARYDDYKFKFKQKATKEFADVWMMKIKEYATWLINLIKK